MRSVVITSEVRVTRSRLSCSSRWVASATSAIVPRPAFSSACSFLRISSAMRRPDRPPKGCACAWTRFQYCCSIELTSAIATDLNRSASTSRFRGAILNGVPLPANEIRRTVLELSKPIPIAWRRVSDQTSSDSLRPSEVLRDGPTNAGAGGLGLGVIDRRKRSPPRRPTRRSRNRL